MESKRSENISAFKVHHGLQPIKKVKRPRKKRRKPTVSDIMGIPDHPREKRSKTCSNVMSGYNLGAGKIVHANATKDKSSFDISFNQKALLKWMIGPVDMSVFKAEYWEKKPLCINGNGRTDFSTLINTPGIEKMLVENNIQFTKNIDITRYENGIKSLYNPEGRARPHVVWHFYCERCSIRLLNPQTYFPNVQKLCSELQEYFGCFVGCNAYLTPSDSQGFAPHYDDIEAFILQIEGKKRWKLYGARNENEKLPRYSSKDFYEIDLGDPTHDIVLKAGDVLYIPRGCIHQACTQDGEHSLHITVSAYQRNAWIDLLEEALTQAKEEAWKNDLKFREGLPWDYLHLAGMAKRKSLGTERAKFEKHVKTLIHKLADHINIDSAVDKLGTRLMQESLPPVLTEEEKKCTVHGCSNRMGENGVVEQSPEFGSEDSEIRLLRNYIARLTKEEICNESGQTETEYRFYYTTDNSLEYRAIEPSFLIVSKEQAKILKYLLRHADNFVRISQIPDDKYETKIDLLYDLWERGIIRTRYPLDT